MICITPYDTPEAWSGWKAFNTEAAEQGVLSRFWLAEMDKDKFYVPTLYPPAIPDVPDMPANGDSAALTSYREAVAAKKHTLGLYTRWRKSQRPTQKKRRKRKVA